MTNSEAMKRTIEALGELGRLEQVDDALVALAQGLASAVDDDPSNASLWRQYQAAEAALREVGKDDSSQVDAFWDRLQTEVRNAKESVEGNEGA